MGKKVKISLILIFIFNIYIPLLPEEDFDIQIKRDGWEMPKLDNFISTRGKHDCGEQYKNCSEEYYNSKEKIHFLVNYSVVKQFRTKLPCIETRTINLIIKGLTIIYYKMKPFCHFYGGEIDCYKGFLAILDMDLDGKFELMLGSPKVIEFFLKYSPKVDEDDRYKGSIYIDGKEIN